jgi:hypothetical protein
VAFLQGNPVLGHLGPKLSGPGAHEQPQHGFELGVPAFGDVVHPVEHVKKFLDRALLEHAQQRFIVVNCFRNESTVDNDGEALVSRYRCECARYVDQGLGDFSSHVHFRSSALVMRTGTVVQFTQ